jgi:alpha-tubulin suppressor-like RCC1 family protein
MLTKNKKTLKLLDHLGLLAVLSLASLGLAFPTRTPAGPVAYSAISAGDWHTCALTSAGGVRCWGYNTYGQLGNGANTESSIPVDVSGLNSGIRAISAGGTHTCALTNNGGVKCWGLNLFGQTGSGTDTTSLNTPVDVSGLSSGVSAIAAGGLHACALTSSGGVKCWGDNEYGQLGDGTQINRKTPVDVSGLTSGVRAITAGYWHTCALTTSGAALCWGWNGNSQLGDGSILGRLTPTGVSGLSSGISAIAAGGFHSCALTNSGSVKCWGSNWAGQLGNGNTQSSPVPVDISGLTGKVTAISAGIDHVCALTGGSARCWGRNDDGRLGNGTHKYSSLPLAVSGLTGRVINAISAGGDHTCALTNTGSIRCWGHNNAGQLGDGTTTDSSSPLGVVYMPLPSPFNKIMPADASTTKTSLSLSWGASSGATSYEYCYDTTDDSACNNWISNGTATSKMLVGLSSGSTYYWQVRARNAVSYIYPNNASDSFWSFKTDGTPPRVTSITRADPDPSTASSLRFNLTFSEPVRGVDVTDFGLTTTGLSGAAVTGVSGSSANYIVAVSTGTGSGTLRLNVVDNDSIQDGVGNPLGGEWVGNGNFNSGPKYSLDRNNQFTSGAAEDGWVLESGPNSGKGGSFNNTSTLLVGDDASNRQYRSLLFFNTASLPDNAHITSVTLKIKKAGLTGSDPFVTHGALLADICKGLFGTATGLLPANFQAPPSKGAVGSFSAVSGSADWYQITLAPDDFPYINLYGPTQFRLRFAAGDNNQSADYLSFYAGEASADQRPLLVVEYTLP